MKNHPIYIIGKGNLGWHLNQLFEFKKVRVEDWINSRIQGSDFNFPENSIIFLAIKDDLIEEKVNELLKIQKNLILIYCSGTVDIVSKYHNQVFCWYPLYSFTKDIEVDWHKVPVFIEVLNENLISVASLLNDKLGLKTIPITALQRQNLHLSAVFINNFTTACAIAASEILNDNKLFEQLQPILSQTIEKIITSKSNLIGIQTGPAKRGDDLVIQKHLELLNTLVPENQLYLALTQYIKQKIK